MKKVLLTSDVHLSHYRCTACTEDMILTMCTITPINNILEVWYCSHCKKEVIKFKDMHLKIKKNKNGKNR